MKCGDVTPLPVSGGIACVSCGNEANENNEGSLTVLWTNRG